MKDVYSCLFLCASLALVDCGDKNKETKKEEKIKKDNTIPLDKKHKRRR